MTFCVGIGGTVEKKQESGEEEGTGNSLIEKVQEPNQAEESVDKMDDNDKTEDNQPASVEATTSLDVSVEESKEVNTSKEANDALVQKEVENESKVVDDAGGCQEQTVEESKEVNGSGSHEEVGDGSKEVCGGTSHKEVDDTQSTTRKIEVPSSKVVQFSFPFDSFLNESYLTEFYIFFTYFCRLARLLVKVGRWYGISSSVLVPKSKSGGILRLIQMQL